MGEQPTEGEQRTPTCGAIRNEAGVITSIEDTVTEILGWRPEQIMGSPSTSFIHPDDQADAISTWFVMIGTPGSTRTFRGRYRTADGGWRWIDCENTNFLDDPDNPHVFTLIRPAEAGELSLAEQIRAREELIARLTDALPVGVFQVDRDRRVLFTNGRLHHILGAAPAPELAGLFAVIADDDRRRLEAAVDATLAGGEVDGLELHFNVVVPHPDFATTRVCQISLRPLTDGEGGVTGAIGCLSDVTESVDLRHELELRASTDTLTGCLNRAAIFEFLDLALRSARETGVGVAAIFVDLNRFKTINDSHGHAVGDKALLWAAACIRGAVRHGDAIGRLGGDEFLIICPNVATLGLVEPVARRISDCIQPMEIAGDRFELSASVGLAWTDGTDESPDVLTARADRAMYQSKTGGAAVVVAAPA
jgi:diguanylate cyclase (GGDEF)-like protein/PAS domain S-box-containing protein